MLNFGVSEAATKPLRPWSSDELRSVAPRTHTLLSTDNPAEIALALELHDRFGTLDFAEPDGGNPWGLRYATLFHSSGAKESRLASSRSRAGSRWVHPRKGQAVPAVPTDGSQSPFTRARWRTDGTTGPEPSKAYTGPRTVIGRKPRIPWRDRRTARRSRTSRSNPATGCTTKVAQKRIQRSSSGGHSMLRSCETSVRPWTDRRVMRVAVLPSPACNRTQLPVLVASNLGTCWRLQRSSTRWYSTSSSALHLPGGT